MGQYISEEDVKTRLIGKVRFTDDLDEKGKMHTLLLRRLISESEGEVELSLSPRYEIPFQTSSDGRFRDLPNGPTRNILRTLCELMACIRVLETDFGSGSAVGGNAYSENLKKRFDEIVGRLLKRKGEENDDASGWFYPPLKGLKLAYFNSEADDGYAGMVINTSLGDGEFARSQVNDPSETWSNATYDDVDSSSGRRDW